MLYASGMDSQRRRERKGKKRERIRKEHLAADKKARESVSLDRLRTDSHAVIPDKNDRDGWQKFNALTRPGIFRKAMAMFSEHALLNRYLQRPNDLTKKDCIELCEMLSRAAQAIACDWPYYVPLVSVRRNADGVETLITSWQMDKEPTPMGNAWHWMSFGKSQRLVHAGGRPLLFAMSTHAIDRMKERVMVPFKLDPEGAVSFMRMFEPLDPIPRPGADSLIPLMFNGKIFGYCPFDVLRHMAVAKSFLIPTMENTPERDRLNEVGLGYFEAETIMDVLDDKEVLKEVDDVQRAICRPQDVERVPA